MAGSASGGAVTLAYVEETTRGTTPGAPTLKYLRNLTRDLNLEVNELVSEEIRASGMESDVRSGTNEVTGTIRYELSLTSHDDFMALALRAGLPSTAWNTPGTGSTGGTGWAVDGTAKTFTFADGGLAAAGYRAGQTFTSGSFTNAANNDSGFLIVSATDTVLTVVEPAGVTLITESADTDATVDPLEDYIDYAKDLHTVTIERRFEDLDTPEYQPFLGVGVDQWTMSISPEAIIGGTFTLRGMSSTAMTQTPLDATPTPAPTNSPFASFEGVIYEAGGASSVVTEASFTINNNLSTRAVIGSKFSPDLYQGTGQCTGTLSVFFEDDASTHSSGAELYNKFFNETESQVMLKLDDPNGSDYIALWFSRLKFTSVPIDVPPEGPGILTVNFRALESTNFGTTLTVVRSNT